MMPMKSPNDRQPLGSMAFLNSRGKAALKGISLSLGSNQKTILSFPNIKRGRERSARESEMETQTTKEMEREYDRKRDRERNMTEGDVEG